MKKTIILAFFALAFISLPSYVRAEFDPTNIIDPFCLFSCDDPEPTIINNTNSNNVNSNVNSPNSTVVDNVNTTPVYTYDYDNSYGSLGVSCYANYSSVGTGDLVTWRASAYGGNGSYHITWSGTNGLSGTGSSATIRYNSPGSKFASVTVVSGGQSISQNCSSVEVYDDNNYNHNDNDYYYDDNDYYDGNLSVSCYADDSRIDIGDSVTWKANVHGGNGNYHYDWDGTNGLSGSRSNVTKRYNSPGTKYASVRVTSGGRPITRNCGDVEVYDYNDDYYDDDRYYDDRDSSLRVTCSVNTTFAPVGTKVVWEARANGGNGNYRYDWHGTDNLDGTNRDLEVFYNSPGTKTAYVIVKSGTRSTSQSCSNSVLVGVPVQTYTNPYPNTPVYTAPVKNVVKKTEAAKTEQKTTLASLFSLNNVPWGLVAIMVILVLVVMIIYLVFNSKKI